MRPTKFCAILQSGKSGGVYFLRGPDGFLHEECRAAAVESLPPETREWALTESAFTPGELQRELENACQMPMLGGRSIIYLTDVDDFEYAAEEDAEALAGYMKRPASFATVVFAAREPDRRRRFIQLLEKSAQVVEMTPLGRREAAAWSVEYLRSAGVQLRPELAENLAARFEGGADASGRSKQPPGVNLLWLRTELEKVLVARHGATHLDEQDLAMIAAPREEHEIGKLLAAVAERKLSAALTLLQDLITSKEPEALLLWMLGDLFRQGLRASGGTRGSWPRAAGGYSTFEIAPRLGKAYSREEMGRALRFIHGADLALKSSWKDSKLVLEALLWRLMAGNHPA